jgi:hypothetical protein
MNYNVINDEENRTNVYQEQTDFVVVLPFFSDQKFIWYELERSGIT